MTVRGPVPVAEMGMILPHEHLVLELTKIFPAQILTVDYQLPDEELTIEELGRFAAAGRTVDPRTPVVVEVTTDARMGRDPVALGRISEALDIHVVMGCGRYREPWYEPELRTMSTRDLAAQLTAEIEHGVGDTGIRPGIIGELGADYDYVSPAEERVLRAGARAHRNTGLTITMHSRYGNVGLLQLDVLEEEGVQPGRVIVGHCDTHPELEYHAAIAARGAWVQFDTIRGRYEYHLERRVRYVLEARRRGFLDRLLLSHDVCAQSHLHTFGGSGYDLLATGFRARLLDAGLSEEEIHRLLVLNPRQALTPAV